MLYQNDAVGKEYLTGLGDGLGVDRAATIVKEVSYEIGDPTVDSQIIALQAAGPDTIFLAALQGPLGKPFERSMTSGGPRRAIS